MTRREELFLNGVQFGHQTRSWCPKMSRYLWGEKDGVHLINIALTELQIEKAEKMLEEIARKGQPILWVGTKRVARSAVMRCAQDTTSPYFAERWIGGTLTNYSEVKKAVTNMLYNKEMLEKADRQMYTKKELGALQKKIEKAEKSVGGIERLSQKPGVIVVVGVKEERVAMREAQRMGIPVVALVDTNCDPTGISVVIPANDDRENGISLILGYLSDAVKRGREVYLQENPLVAAADKEAQDLQKKSSAKKSVYGSRPAKNVEHAQEAAVKKENPQPSADISVASSTIVEDDKMAGKKRPVTGRTKDVGSKDLQEGAAKKVGPQSRAKEEGKAPVRRSAPANPAKSPEVKPKAPKKSE